MQDPSETVTITGTREGIEKAEHDIKVILEEQVNYVLNTLLKKYKKY